MFIPCSLAPRPCAISVITTTCWLYASAASFLVAGISAAPVQRRLQRRSEVEEPTKPWYLTSSEHITAFQSASRDSAARSSTWIASSHCQPQTLLPHQLNKENRSSFRAGSLLLHRFSCQPHHHLLDLSPTFLPALDDPSSPHMSSMKLSLASTWPCTECFRMMLRSFSSSCSCSHFPFSWRPDCLCPPWFFPFYIFCSLLRLLVHNVCLRAAAFRGTTLHRWFACLHFLPSVLRCGLKPWLGVPLVWPVITVQCCSWPFSLHLHLPCCICSPLKVVTSAHSYLHYLITLESHGQSDRSTFMGLAFLNWHLGSILFYFPFRWFLFDLKLLVICILKGDINKTYLLTLYTKEPLTEAQTVMTVSWCMSWMSDETLKTLRPDDQNQRFEAYDRMFQFRN